MAVEAKRYNLTQNGPITLGYSTMFRGAETHLAGGLANILLFLPSHVQNFNKREP